MKFVDPSEGSIAPMKELVGHLLVIQPLELVHGVTTRYTKPGETASVIKVNMVSFDPNQQYAATEHLNVGIFPPKLVDQVSAALGTGSPMLAWLQTKDTRPGHNPLFELIPASGQPEIVSFVEQYLASHPLPAASPAVGGSAPAPPVAPPAAQNAAAGIPAPPAGPSAPAAPPAGPSVPAAPPAVTGPPAVPGPATVDPSVLQGLPDDVKAQLMQALQNQK